MMKQIAALILIAFLSACNAGIIPTEQKENTVKFYTGTYTDGDSRGIYACSLDYEGMPHFSGLAAQAENPSFLAFTSDRRFLLAVNESAGEDGGSVESFRIGEDTLLHAGSCPSGGDHPCHLAVYRDGFVVTSNYSSGSVALLKIDSTGFLAGPLDIRKHSGKGPTDRQEGPHAHSSLFVPGDNLVISADLGTDALWFTRIDADGQKLSVAEPPWLKLVPGSGPRHMVMHPAGHWIYVVNELANNVTIIKRDEDNGWEMVRSYSTLPEGFEGANTCADIHITADGSHLYASNRGHNSIAIFSAGAKDGSLELLGFQDTHGDWPRNFNLSPGDRFLVVANQHGGNIVSFSRNPSTGLLTYIGEIQVPEPVCILF